jgi:hypothetical protein
MSTVNAMSGPRGEHRPELKVRAEYQAYALWTVDETGGVDNPDPRTLVPGPLGDDLDRWTLDYDALWDDDDPRGPVFADAAAQAAFYERGRTLAERLAEQVGGQWRVRYQQADGSYVDLT